MTHKTCTKCIESKPISEFFAQKCGKFGVDSRCKLCKKAYDNARRDTDEHRAKHAAEEKAWRQANPDKYKLRVNANRENLRESSKQCGRRWRLAEPERHLYYKVKQRAKAKNVPFNIDVEDIKIPEFCPVLGLKLVTGKGAKPFGWNTASVDQIIPGKGYIKGNICVISFRANRIKCDATLKELQAVTKYLAEAIASQSNPSTT